MQSTGRSLCYTVSYNKVEYLVIISDYLAGDPRRENLGTGAGSYWSKAGAIHDSKLIQTWWYNKHGKVCVNLQILFIKLK